jgi:hypothetical protein
MPDIFDEIAPDKASGGDIFDEIAPDSHPQSAGKTPVKPSDPRLSLDPWDNIHREGSFDAVLYDVRKNFQHLSRQDQIRMAAERMRRAIPKDPTSGEAFVDTVKELPGEIAKGVGRSMVVAPIRTAGRAVGMMSFPARSDYDSEESYKEARIAWNEQQKSSPNVATRLGDAIDETFQRAFPQPEQPGLEHGVAQGVGNLAGMLATGGALKAAGAGVGAVTAGATAMGGVSEFDDAFNRSVQRGDDSDTAFAKSLGYASVAMLIENKLGAGRLLRQYFPDALTAAKKLTALGVSKAVAGNVLAGAIEETSQAVAQDVIVDEKLPTAESVGQNFMQEGLPGAIIEGGFGLPGAVVQSLSQDEEYQKQKRFSRALDEMAKRQALEATIPNGAPVVPSKPDIFDEVSAEISQSQAPRSSDVTETTELNNKTSGAVQATSPASGASTSSGKPTLVSGALDSIKAAQANTQQRADVQAAEKPYSAEQALNDLGSVIADIKAKLEQNQISKHSGKPDATVKPAQTITGSNVQPGTEMPVQPEAQANAGAAIELLSPRAAEKAGITRDALIAAQEKALAEGRPINAESVDRMAAGLGTKPNLPQGYARQGDNYVKSSPPQGTGTAAGQTKLATASLKSEEQPASPSPVKKPLPQGQHEISKDQAVAIHGGRKGLLPKPGETKAQLQDTSGEYFIGQTTDGRFFTEHRPKQSSQKPSSQEVSTPAKWTPTTGKRAIVQLRPGGKEHFAMVGQVQPDGSATVRISGEKDFRQVDANQLFPTKAEQTRQAKKDEVAHLSPAQQEQMKQDAAEFDTLVEDHAPQLGWAPGEAYDRNTDMQEQGVANGRLREQARKAAARAAGVEMYQDNSITYRAAALPKLEAYLRQQFPGDNSVAKRRALEEFGRSEPETPSTPEQQARVKQDEQTLRRVIDQNPVVSEFQNLQVYQPAKRGNASGQTGQLGGNQGRKRVVSAGERQAIRELDRVLGTHTIIVDSPGAEIPFNGARVGNSNIILLHARAKAPLLTVMGHELWHHIERTHPGLADEAKAALAPLIQNHADFMDRLRLRGQAKADPESELVGDFLGDNFGRKEFWDDLNRREPNLFKRLARIVKGWLDKLIAKLKGEKPKGFESEQYFSDLEHARDVVANALVQAARETQYRAKGIPADVATETQSAQEGERFSKRDDSPGFFDAPESVSEQKARQGVEKRKADEARAKQSMQERAGAKLTGADVDTTREMFGSEVKQDKAGQGSLFSKSEREKGPLWRSNIQDALESWQNKGTPEQLRAHLAKTKGAMDEAEWIGLDEFLKDKPSVTKHQVAEFVKANTVDVQEVSHSDQKPLTAIERNAKLNELAQAKHGQNFDNLPPGDRFNIQNSLEIQDAGERTKFANYQLPGGENYRELLLTLPEDQNRAHAQHSERIKELIARRDKMRVALERYPNAPADDRARMETDVRNTDMQISMAMREKPKDRGAFRSSHFDEPNILAHVRFNERTDADGKRVLFIEGVQSDWRQKGRKEGYGAQSGFKVVDENGDMIARQPTRDAAERIADNYRAGTTPLQQQTGRGGAAATVVPVTGDIQGVPNAPFKQTWPMLAMKRMIRYASENGFDRIAWTTGEQQAERYDLSKQIEEVRLLDSGKGHFRFAAWDKSNQLAFEKYFDKAPSHAELEEYIGKEPATKLLEAVDQKNPKSDGTFKSISGLDLKVGGEGMKGFYDKILPGEVNKYVKKWGGRVGRAAIPTGEEGAQFEVVLPSGKVVATESTKRLADNTAKMFDGAVVRQAASEVHSLDITPAMRDAAMQGMPLFSKPEAWKQLKQDVADAEDKLREAIRVAGNATVRQQAGISTVQARNQKSIATAELRRAQDDLRTNPSYVEHLMRRTKEIQQEINALRGADGTIADKQRKADLEGEFETLNYELSEAPKKLVSKIYNDKFMSGDEKTAREKRAGSQATGTTGTSNAPGGGEIAPESKAARIKAAVINFPATLRGAKNAAVKTTQKLSAMWSARENRDMIAATYDAAENGGELFGRQAANEVLHTLNRSFGAPADRVGARNPVREQALSFVVESNISEAELQDFKMQIKGSDFADSKQGKEALKAIEFAENHWERIEPAAQLYKQITDAQVEHENLAGVETLQIKGGYVMHMTDTMANHALPDVGSAGGNISSPFLKTRVHSTFADAIGAGEAPKSINAVDLIQRRLALGQKLINHGAWVDGMFRYLDPKTQTPIVMPTITKVRKDGKEYEDAPHGFVKMQLGAQTFAVMRGYDGLIKSIITPSTIRNSVAGNVAMELAGGIKHSMLVFDSYHLGRLAFWSSMVRGNVLPGDPTSYRRGLTLLDNTIPEIQRMVEGGEIPKAWLKDLIESKRQLALLVSKGLNVGSVGDNIATHFVQNLPIAGTFNKFLFQKYQRGATAEASLIELRRQIKMNPDVSEDVLARRVASDLNKRFGNLQNQSWIKNKNLADIARIIFLAPQWNESLIRSEIGAAKEIGKAPFDSWRTKRVNIGLLGRAVATALIGTFIANQIINMITRGKPTWENEEEENAAKLSAWIPDVVGDGPGFFLNPLTLPAEMSELLLKKTERTGDMTQAAKQVFASRLGPLGRVPYTLAVREDALGAKLRTGPEVLGQMASSLVPLPISGGTLYGAGKQMVTGEHEEKYPGQFQRQAFQTFGVKLDAAPSPDQRIRSLAKEFNREKGITPAAEFFHGDYYDLDRAAIIGNQREMAKAMAVVLEKKSKEDIRKHYDRWATAPFTGKAEREHEFVKTLDAEQRATLDAARARRKLLKNEILKQLH